MIHLIRTNEDVSRDKSSKTKQLSPAFIYLFIYKKNPNCFYPVEKPRNKVNYLVERYNICSKHTPPEILKYRSKNKSTGLKVVTIGIVI